MHLRRKIKATKQLWLCGLIFITYYFVTVTLQTAVLPFVLLTVTVVVPTDLPVTFPYETVAIFGSATVHFTDLSVAFEGETEV